jgi:DNA-binding transcriptional regulator YiaG
MTPEKIKETRVALQRSQDAFARVVGVTARTVARWEKGLAVPHPATLEKLEKFAAYADNLTVKAVESE